MRAILPLLILITSFENLREVKPHVYEIASNQFMLGNEALIEMSDSPLKGKRIGLITNNSGVLSDGRLFMDLLSEHHDLRKIFTPEHGLRGNERNEDYTDEATGAFVVSLYGNKEKPASSDLSDVDVLVYDLQDVSARFYTFVNTLYYCMQAATENDKKIVICDRPIIPDANYVDGFVLEDSYKSFVGLLNVPAAYAMTCGELALLINSEYLDNKCDLEISKMKNYSRDMNYDDLNLYWKTPSPNMYFPSTAVAYLGTCLFEGTNFGEGRGSNNPFEYVGAPYCDGDLLARELNSMNFKGVVFEPITFIPKQIMSWQSKPKYADEVCSGVYMKITDRKVAEPYKVAVAILVLLNKRFSQFQINSNNFIDKLAGTDKLRNMIISGRSYEDIISSYQNDLNDFKKIRKKYLLY
ncbi:MAG: DUF1343 domain-containing protein [Ignavibacteria bacterium]|nr:DUF1343 domain-containing protein [Ignavibacteria bacterium]